MKCATVIALLLAGPLVVEAQPAGKVYRVGFLGTASAASYAPQVRALREGLRDLGYIEGKNIVLEYRWAEGRYDALPALAAELVRLQPDVLVTHGTPGTRALKEATTTVPIVMAVAGDAVGTGLITSITRPGGNVTGSSFFNPEIAAKRLELLKQAVPRLARVAVLLNPGNPISRIDLKAMEPTARLLNLELLEVAARVPEELEGALSVELGQRVNGLIVLEDGMLIGNVKRIVELAAARRLPGVGFKEYAEAGGLMAYGVNFPEIWRRAAVFVDKILKGAKPVDLPVEQPTKFEFVINLRTAKSLGVRIPPSLLLRADHIIE
jgi:putative ABC transport system substrate-binding protein